MNKNLVYIINMKCAENFLNIDKTCHSYKKSTQHIINLFEMYHPRQKKKKLLI